MPLQIVNSEEEIIKRLSEQLAAEIDKEILKKLDDYIDENISEMEYDNKKQKIDPIYLHNIKQKVEQLLDKIIEKFNLAPYIDDMFRYRLAMPIYIVKSGHHELFIQKKDINGNQLQYGFDYIPTDFEDWMRVNLPDYMTVIEIYTNMCASRRVQKDDLKQLNKIAKKYIKDETDGSN